MNKSWLDELHEYRHRLDEISRQCNILSNIMYEAGNDRVSNKLHCFSTDISSLSNDLDTTTRHIVKAGNCHEYKPEINK